MNAKRVSIIIFVFALLLSACAPTQLAKPGVVTVEVLKTVQVEKPAGQSQGVVPTAAPAYNQPPAAATQAAEPAGEVSSYSVATPMPAPTQPMLNPGSVPPPADAFFQNYGVNPYMDTREDHLSTFALDVDTASYSVARDYLTDGNIPPIDAIRVEEFVNYFNMGYPTPEGMAFGIYADGAPSPFGQEGTYYLRFGIQGYRVSEWERQPLVLTFVIDTSGSMAEDNRLELVKQAMTLLVDRLREGDSVAIVAYTTSARVVLNPTPGNNRDAILNALYGLYPQETTNVADGLHLGYQLAMQAYRSGATNRVILCSDGVANVGGTSADAILAEVRGYVSEGINLTAIGVGMGNYNDVLLEQLADSGNGNYAYVDNIDEARKVFVEDFTGTMQVIARDAKVQVDFNPEIVAYYRLLGYENRAVADQDFRNDAVDAGELGAGHSATAIYAVQFRPGAEGRIATVQLRWEDPQTSKITEINGNFNTWDLYNGFDVGAPRYQLAILVAQFAEMLRHSYYASGTSGYQLLQYANRLPNIIPEDSEVTEFVSLVEQAYKLGALGPH